MYKYAQNKIEGKITELNECDSFSIKTDYPSIPMQRSLSLSQFIRIQNTARPKRRAEYKYKPHTMYRPQAI
jgi:hypothetical protein